MKATNYRATHNEANFGKPISSQVAGGTHITFEMITRQGKTFYMTRWPTGLPGHDDPPNVLRFPHGLIRVGESLEKCASRLVREQLGMSVRRVRIAYWDSYLDEFKHWHVEPGCIVDVDGRPRVPHGASEIVTFTLRDPPAMTFWKRKDLIDVLRTAAPDTLVDD